MDIFALLRAFFEALGDNGTAALVAAITVGVPVLWGRAARESRRAALKAEALAPALPAVPVCAGDWADVRAELAQARDARVALAVKVDVILDTQRDMAAALATLAAKSKG